jgi:hypothetical protein
MVAQPDSHEEPPLSIEQMSFHKRFASPVQTKHCAGLSQIKEPFGGHHTRGNNDSKLLRVEHPERTLMKNRLMEREESACHCVLGCGENDQG